MGIVYQASWDHPLRDSTCLISPGYPGINPRGYSRTSLLGLVIPRRSKKLEQRVIV